MQTSRDILAEAARLQSVFLTAGAAEVQADILQPAETLLDLYGEDIRARAYVTSDALRGEQMLRPDFTVPVVQMHMEHGAEPARYTYNGIVFRRQEDDPNRANEYVQVGYEVFDRANPAQTDAEVFALIFRALNGLSVRAVTGDIGILTAAVQGLNTSDRRKAALMRHIWRPRRFRALLDRFAGRAPVPETRARLLAAADPFAQAGPFNGVRTKSEIQDRIDALHDDAQAPAISTEDMALIDAILTVSDTCPVALDTLRDLAGAAPNLTEAVERLSRRIDALENQGIAVDTLMFEASYGRTSMEYYDGFVFGFYAVDHPELPPVATGGRYDALTRRLGQGAEIPAVGGVIRPDLTLGITGGSR
jgi:ATP phosphoribosyltransferase regulatory subunit